jgi:hypothetical protein
MVQPSPRVQPATFCIVLRKCFSCYTLQGMRGLNCTQRAAETEKLDRSRGPAILTAEKFESPMF